MTQKKDWDGRSSTLQNEMMNGVNFSAMATPVDPPGFFSARPVMFGVDLASGKNQTALALISSDGKTREIVHLDKLRTRSGSRKEDRQMIARALILLATAHGAQVERTDERSCITLRISLASVGALVDIDNVLGGDTSMISWHNMEHPARNFTPRFCKLVGGGMFARPHRKATSLPGDWYSLAMMLDAGLLLAARSEAFAPDPGA